VSHSVGSEAVAVGSGYAIPSLVGRPYSTVSPAPPTRRAPTASAQDRTVSYLIFILQSNENMDELETSDAAEHTGGKTLETEPH